MPHETAIPSGRLRRPVGTFRCFPASGETLQSTGRPNQADTVEWEYFRQPCAGRAAHRHTHRRGGVAPAEVGDGIRHELQRAAVRLDNLLDGSQPDPADTDRVNIDDDRDALGQLRIGLHRQPDPDTHAHLAPPQVAMGPSATVQQVAATNWTYSGGSCMSSGGNSYSYVRGGDRDGGGPGGNRGSGDRGR